MNAAFKAYSVLFIGILLVGEMLPARTEPVYEKIAFATERDGNNEIYIMDTDGSNQTNITRNPSNDWDPAWSPDGTMIAFSSDRDGNEEIYIMNADGSDQRRITRNSSRDWQPAWSPDGEKIAFVSDRDGDDEIYIMNANGWFQKRLTKNDCDDWDPAWSPDGEKIAFTSERDSMFFEIYVMNADGSDPRRLTHNEYFDWDPAWAPDGAKIAFSQAEDIYVMNADGSNQVNISDCPAVNIDPAWAPDETMIVFCSSTRMTQCSMTLYNSGRDWAHRWSLDGTKMAFFTQEVLLDIYVMNADGSNQRNLTPNVIFNDFLPSWGRIQAPLTDSSEDRIGSYSIFLIIILIIFTILILAFRKNIFPRKI